MWRWWHVSCGLWQLGVGRESSQAVACEFMPKRLTSGACINSIEFANVVVAHWCVNLVGRQATGRALQYPDHKPPEQPKLKQQESVQERSRTTSSLSLLNWHTLCYLRYVHEPLDVCLRYRPGALLGTINSNPSQPEGVTCACEIIWLGKRIIVQDEL